MNVSEFLKTIPEDVHIKLSGGTSFVYCGPVTPWLIEFLMWESNNEYKKILNSYEERTNHRDNFNSFWALMYKKRMDELQEKYKRDMNLGKGSPSEKKRARDYEKLKEKWEADKARDWESTLKSIERLITRRDYTPFNIPDREVIECYDSIDPDTPNTKIITYDGDWFGKYWYEDEFNNDEAVQEIVSALVGEVKEDETV